MNNTAVMLVACNWRREHNKGLELNAIGIVPRSQLNSDKIDVEIVLPRQVAGEKLSMPRKDVIILATVIDLAEIEDQLPRLLLRAFSRQIRATTPGLHMRTPAPVK